ncbi:diacylglycerol/lipid kinase family protein [Microbacterium esteraromaticum]|uniref:diacylglycerol/lipid kinase family protein n=1 Tax=Microbacterium esteraromaticum TaxID=57043 RepID=UPI00195EBAA7|nr:diacylglycerol kinase family protein [Microbacterium esteraromaticum]MBM7464601.1 diacylglycerol kinase (ATP) [Microbacterium esteraromaticum]
MGSAAPRLLLVINPGSGRGRGAHAGDRAAEALRSSGAIVHAVVGETADRARELVIDALRQRWDGMVVVGGDGTLSGIVDLVMDAALPVAVVPAGTGDDFARALGIADVQPPEAAMAVLTGIRRPTDLGTATSHGRTRVFLTVAAMGFDAKVSERTNRLRWPGGRLRYHVALAIELLRLRPTRFRIAIDGAPSVCLPGTLFAVGNTSSYGGGMPMCMGARADDGLLDAVHVAPLSRSRLLRLFPLLLRGAHLTRPEVDHEHCRRVHVSAQDLMVYADGERIGVGECEIGIIPDALVVMLPRR